MRNWDDFNGMKSHKSQANLPFCIGPQGNNSKRSVVTLYPAGIETICISILNKFCKIRKRNMLISILCNFFI